VAAAARQAEGLALYPAVVLVAIVTMLSTSLALRRIVRT
jgi:hypothetical protein